MSQPATEPRFPAGRYGRRRERSRTPRWVVGALMALVVVAGLAMSVALYRQYGAAEYRGEVVAYQLAEDGVTIRLEVTKPVGESATCIVRARARNGEEVGRAELNVPAGKSGAERVAVTYTLATSAPPVIGEVVGCAPAGT